MKKIFISTILSFLFISCSVGQDSAEFWKNKFDAALFSEYKDNKFSSREKYNKLSKSADQLHFMALSYGVNALNTMYKATNDLKYLEINSEIIKNVIDKSVPLSTNNKRNSKTPYKGWVAKSRVKEYNIDKDIQLYDGYLFRYVAEYLYLIHTNELMNSSSELKESYNIVLNYLENDVWKRWYEESIAEKGDLSLFFAIRTHMGSHWAAIALYLNELSNENEMRPIYEEVVNVYNSLLRNNFQVVDINGNKAYLWRSTYDNFSNSKVSKHKIRMSKEGLWQDVSHGNQVIDYIILSYEMKQEWDEKDISFLVNTLRFLIWDEDKLIFNDYLETDNKNNGLPGTGWKQSDGWLKLARFDKSLLKLFESLYENNIQKIDKSSLALQFYANMAYGYLSDSN